jgi:type I restriction enzyme M protein
LLKQKDASVKYIEINNINPEMSEIHSFSEMKVHELPSRASYDLKKGDIITAVSGISTGTSKHASAYITEDYDGCICTNGFRVLRPQNIDPYYLLAFLKTDFFLDQMLQFRTGSAIPAVNDRDLKNVLILPPNSFNEQKLTEKIKNSLILRKKARIEMDAAIKLLNSIGEKHE